MQFTADSFMLMGRDGIIGEEFINDADARTR